MIQAILFDVGGVYLEGSFADFVNKSRRVLGIDEEYRSEREVSFNPGMHRGETTVERSFEEYFGVPISKAQMRQLTSFWTTTWKLTDEMAELVAALKKSYRLAILSNSDPVNSPNYAARGWYKAFDVVVLSHEEHASKPDRKIYDIAVQRLGIRPEECLFIDDQEACLATARTMGMETILFRSVPQLKEELQKKGVGFSTS